MPSARCASPLASRSDLRSGGVELYPIAHIGMAIVRSAACNMQLAPVATAPWPSAVPQPCGPVLPSANRLRLPTEMWRHTRRHAAPAQTNALTGRVAPGRQARGGPVPERGRPSAGESHAARAARRSGLVPWHTRVPLVPPCALAPTSSRQKPQTARCIHSLRLRARLRERTCARQCCRWHWQAA